MEIIGQSYDALRVYLGHHPYFGRRKCIVNGVHAARGNKTRARHGHNIDHTDARRRFLHDILLFILIPPTSLFGFAHGAAAHDLQVLFWIVYGVLCLITIVLYIGIFKSPSTIALILSKIFSLPILRRWRKSIDELNESLISTSGELRGKPLKWWAAPIAATVVSWISRFAVVNALMLAFIPEADQLTVMGRQFVVWALLTFTPTPGGSGVSEMLFKTYYSDFIAGPIMMVIAIIWRIFTYYVYLLIGFCMIPTFLKSKK